MALKIDDSGDEFPNLAVILRSHSGVVLSNMPVDSPHVVSAAQPMAYALHHQKGARPRTGAQSFNCHSLGGYDLQAGKSPNKPKPRKRVLNRISDNPLLRPLHRGTHSILHPVEISKRSKKEKVLRSKMYEQSSGMGGWGLGEFSEEDHSAQDSTGLSDFIVNDSSFLEGEGEITEEGVQTRKARSTRKLVRGKKLSSAAAAEEGSSTVITPKLANATLPYPITRVLKPDKRRGAEHNSLFDETELLNHDGKELDTSGVILTGGRVVSKSKGQALEADLTQALSMIQTQRTKNKSAGYTLDGMRPATPPSSNQRKQTKLGSPKKLSRIPSTPHRPSMDAFWSQDVINGWNDEFSLTKPAERGSRQSDNESDEDLPEPCKGKSHPTRDRKLLESKKLFDQKKRAIGEAFLRELDDAITGGTVSELAASTGGIKIVWSKTLNTTAGRANWRRETASSEITGPDGKPSTKYTHRHHASIELAEKVINEENRLLNVIAHEFCHLANFMVSGIKDKPHGKEFKSWAWKCSQHFESRGIHVTTKHSYTIDYKYIWECTNCGTEFRRHSKSINPSKQQCGSCKGKLQQTKPVPRVNVARNEYQDFMKEHMQRVRKENPGSPQKQIMGLMGKMYQEYKAAKPGSNVDKADDSDCHTDKAFGSKGPSTFDSEVDLVMRRLDFLDITKS